MEHLVSHEGKTMYIETVWNHDTHETKQMRLNEIDLGKDILVINKTKVFLNLWQSTRSEPLRQAISCHSGGRLMCELDPSPGHLMQP